jgi:hypothetical protein
VPLPSAKNEQDFDSIVPEIMILVALNLIIKVSVQTFVVLQPYQGGNFDGKTTKVF